MAPHPSTPRIVTFGETMAMLRSGGIGRLAQARDVSLTVGGAESNVAIGAHRLGVPALWVSRLGADPFGELIEGTIRGTGVGALVSHDAEHRSGFAVREQRTADRTRMTYYRAGSAAATTRASDLDAAVFDAVAAADVFHTSGISLAVGPQMRETVFALARHARASGTLVSFDVNHRATMWSEGEAREHYRALLQLSDICFAGDDEARLILDAPAPSSSTGAELRSLASGVSRFGPGTVVVKLGDRGALALAAGEYIEQSAVRVSVVDTVGAGDAFVAGYLSALADVLAPAECLDRGIRCGAIACASEGDWEGNPTLAELDSLLDTGDPVLR